MKQSRSLGGRCHVERVGEVALALARRDAPITAEKLCELTGYSRPTVNAALKELCRLKVVVLRGGREGGRGRKARFIVRFTR
ncbi:MAG: MarR family transcriptional regulator [Candidatus Bipolaricaulia bacterium]